MKKSLIWTAVGAVVIGFGVPAYAAVQTSKPQPSISVVAPARQAASATHSQRSVTVDDSTRNSIDDNGVDANATHDVNDDNGVDATVTSIDDNGVDATVTSIDDNGVDANDTADDNGVDAPVTSIDDNGVDAPTNTVDDSGHHNGGDDSGHGGSDG